MLASAFVVSRLSPQPANKLTTAKSSHPRFNVTLVAGGIRWIHIPSKGGAEASTALLGGHVDAFSGSSGLQLVDAGKFRLLATYGEQRSERYGHVPTLKESGYNVICNSPLGIIGPKGMPSPIVDRLHDAFKRAMEDPEFQATMKKFDMSKLYLNTEQYESFFRQESENIGKLVQKLGLRKK